MQKNLPGVCFFGCGEIAARHAKILKKIYPEIKISFASRDKDKSESYRSKFKGSMSFGSYIDALESSDLDIAFITTPHAYHSEIAVLAADNNKHLIIEKPITRNRSELDSIVKAVKKNSVRCTVAENYMYKPFLKNIREYISSGIIGDVLFIELNKTNRDSISGWRTDPELMGGGALLEGGIHWVNLLVSLAGSVPSEVIALKPDIVYDTNVPFEDSISVNVKFENGVAAKLLHSWRIPNPLKGMAHSKIYGTEGVITFESNGLYVSARGKKRKFSVTNPLDFLGFNSMHKTLISNYIDNKPWEPSLERITYELDLVEAAYRSLKTKRLEKI